MPDRAFLITAGILLIITGIFFLIIGTVSPIRKSHKGKERGFTPYQEVKEEKVKSGGVILIGPIPIVFGSDKRFMLIAMILAIFIMLLAIIFMRS